MTTELHGWATELDTLLTQVWARLVRGVGDRHAPARHPVFATVAPDCTPEVRTVVLRAADPVAGTLDIHTDLRSAKVAALRQHPVAALHIWDASAHLQTRITASVEVLTAEAVEALWQRVPETSQAAYGTTPAPGTPIAAALDYHKRPDPAAFAVLRCAVFAIDALHLGPNHRRARFDRADGWQGQWLAP
jgi:pyridoxamine 5'-phosphate oxidase